METKVDKFGVNGNPNKDVCLDLQGHGFLLERTTAINLMRDILKELLGYDEWPMFLICQECNSETTVRHKKKCRGGPLATVTKNVTTERVSLTEKLAIRKSRKS